MAQLLKNNNLQQLSQQQLLSSKYQSARHNILLVVIFTLINLFLLITNTNSYFLFSAIIPYYIVDLAMFLCGKYPADFYTGEYEGMIFAENSFFVAAVVTAVVVLILYLVSWFYSKKPRVGFMIFALVFFAIDTAAMLWLSGVSSDMIMDIVFHGWVIVSLANGVISYYKLKKLPEEAETPVAEAESLNTEGNAVFQNSGILRIADTEAKARILLEAELAGYKVEYRRIKKVNELVVNGNVYDEYEALVEFPHILQANIGGHRLEAGMDAASNSFIQVDGQIVAKKRRLF